MKLTRIRIRNFRSLWSEATEPSADIELAEGANYFAGENNAGKSNLFRALELALGTNPPEFDPERDWPAAKKWVNSTIELEFDLGSAHAIEQKGPVGTLAKLADAYERTVQGCRDETYAMAGQLRYHVQFSTTGARTEKLLANGAGARTGQEDELKAVLAQFHKVVRFVDIRSGESLEHMMERGFREILGSVLKEEFREALQKAEVQRLAYINELTQGVLNPLAQHIRKQLAKHVPDLKDVELVPEVGTVDDAIIGAHFELTDAAKTHLEQKGTGVRGAVLLTLMSFIAEASKRAVVFAIEEPESFLHPGTHRALGQALEKFTGRKDVSLLMTTHSPFLFGTGPGSKVFSVTKSPSGKTDIQEGDRNHPAQRARRLLLGNAPMSATSDKLNAVPDGAKLIVLVEGYSDRRYLELAAAATGTSLEGIHIVDCAGADDAALKAVIFADVFGRERLLVLLDSDDPGRRAHNLLTTTLKNTKIQGDQVLMYSKWTREENIPIEAEDLFPPALLEQFLEGHEEWMSEMNRGRVHRHFGLTQAGKDAFLPWLERAAKPSDYTKWKAVIDELRKRIEKLEQGQKRREATHAGPKNALKLPLENAPTIPTPSSAVPTSPTVVPTSPTAVSEPAQDAAVTASGPTESPELASSK